MVSEHYLEPVPKAIGVDERQMKYRRRVLRITGNSPRWVAIRTALLLSVPRIGCLNVVFTVYGALFMDFGPREHCFSGLRRMYAAKRAQFLALDSNDLKELQ